jgi:hypothetical protein
MHMLAGLSDGGEGDTYVTDICAASEPAKLSRRPPKPSVNPVNWFRGAWHTASGMTTAAASTVEGTLEILDGLLRPGSRSSLTDAVTNMRRYGAVQVPLADVAAVCDTFDVTLNDVALAAITDSYRAAIMWRNERPRGDSLRTLVPVSVRSNDAVDLPALARAVPRGRRCGLFSGTRAACRRCAHRPRGSPSSLSGRSCRDRRAKRRPHGPPFRRKRTRYGSPPEMAMKSASSCSASAAASFERVRHSRRE